MQTESLWRIWKWGACSDCFAELANEDKYEVHLRVRLMHRLPQRKKGTRKALSHVIGFSHLFVSAWRSGVCCISDSNPLTVILGSVCCVFMQEANLKFCTYICVYADYFFYQIFRQMNGSILRFLKKLQCLYRLSWYQMCQMAGYNSSWIDLEGFLQGHLEHFIFYCFLKSGLFSIYIT